MLKRLLERLTKRRKPAACPYQPLTSVRREFQSLLKTTDTEHKNIAYATPIGRRYLHYPRYVVNIVVGYFGEPPVRALLQLWSYTRRALEDAKTRSTTYR